MINRKALTALILLASSLALGNVTDSIADYSGALLGHGTPVEAGYAIGFVESISISTNSLAMSCIPKDTTRQTLILSVGFWIHDHTEMWAGYTPHEITSRAMMTLWPCKSNKVDV